MRDWHPGLEVICIDDTRIPNWEKIYSARLIRGQKYTLREVRLSDKPSICLVAVTLNEIVGNTKQDGQEYAFYGRRFRRVVPPKTGMQILKEALEPVPKKKERLRIPEKIDV